jgi:transcriptional regulator with XRE-family HTH domain
MELRIKELRKDRGLTLAELADKVGLSVSYMSQLENGKRNVNALRLDAIARALEVRTSELLRDGVLSSEIEEHLRILRKLAVDDQMSIFRLARALHREREERDK